jgi:hypothetical protein
MKELFRTTNFRPAALEKIDQMNVIIDEYQEQDLRLTARQLYYQFVSRDLIPNQPAEYKKLTALLTDARYAGLVDWDAIEDRGRVAASPSEFDDIGELTRVAMRAYRLPRWEGQDHYAELWVEKQALAGVLEPLASEFHATLMVNKGYSSASAMKESAERLINKADDREIDIFYLGDHDPSGEDMVRDIEERLAEFGVCNLAVVKIALTTHQVKQYRPPPNPAKLTDPRAAAYIAKHGNKSWEVDALPPNVLAQLIRAAFEAILDVKKMDAIKRREEADKKRLLAAVRKLTKRPGQKKGTPE